MEDTDLIKKLNEIATQQERIADSLELIAVSMGTYCRIYFRQGGDFSKEFDFMSNMERKISNTIQRVGKD